ncbi:MAG: glycoside hydrolase family 99-like domain-containing protein, partial [Verrucomicrobiota bacterium]
MTAMAEAPRIMAYYYPWYTEGDWSRHDYPNTPTLGTYGTDAPEIVEQHIDWCADHGLEGFFVSWWGRKHLTEQHLQSGFMKAKNLRRIKFALYYESLGLLDKTDGKADGIVDFSQPGPLTRLIEDFRYLKIRYLSHPSYLTINGRPVIGLYVTRTFRHFTAEHVDRLKRVLGFNPYLIADEAFFGEQADPDSARNGPGIFDAYSAYNMFENAKVKEGESALAYQSREAFPIFRSWAEKVPFIPGVFPSYKDFRGHEPLPGTPEDFATLI